ncbi:MAG TPA: alpha/beta hydrolase [Solirubrobacterales bacterium]
MPKIDVGGTELYYERAGSGEPLLLIQGMSATHLAWGEPLLAALEASFDLVVFDNRGMGHSGRAELPFEIVDLARDTIGLLDALEIESAHVVGMSMGGMIAQELALAHSERVRTLTLGATYCGGPEGTLMDPADLQLLGAAMATGEREAVYRAMWEINMSPRFRGEQGDERFAAFCQMAGALRAPGPVILQQMRACGAHDTHARLASLAVPVQVIHGTEDRLLKVGNGRQIAALVGVEPKLLEGAGHMFWWEEPEEAAALIRSHALSERSRPDPAFPSP